MATIKVANSAVELASDEIARFMRSFVRDKLVLPYLDLDLKYYDLGTGAMTSSRQCDRTDHNRQ